MNPRPPSDSVETLVIGCGNELRGDDAVGALIAAAVNDWHLPGVRGLPCHQLTPELSEIIARAKQVIFVDAAIERESNLVEAQSIEPASVASLLGHIGDPRSCLALSQTVFGRYPPAWQITVPARDFEFGAPPSATAREGLNRALEIIQRLSTSCENRKALHPPSLLPDQ